MNFPKEFDVVVIGAGHAGVEAAMASARSGVQTLLITHNLDTIGQLSCNPAIGGIGKSHLVREIDAMGGVMGELADKSGIQWRILNSRKGPAVRATRAQIDRNLYRLNTQKLVQNQENLFIFQQAVDDLIIENDKVCGVKTQIGIEIKCKTVVLTTGTFLNGVVHIGMEHYKAGRATDAPSISLAQRLKELPLRVGRLKTGTPPRIDARTVDFSQLEVQGSDYPLPQLSFWQKATHLPQMNCYIARTNEKTHTAIMNNLDRSPLYAGIIDGIGPRYCPSIEDKVHRFADKESHQIFIEPEGLNSNELYPNGISTSLPFDVQVKIVQSMKGLENAYIMRPGYAIEYDFFNPQDLKYSMESKYIENLFFAGQINGTTGYEEAGAQGILAGINASLKAQEKSPWHPSRSQAYLGVLIDDLITLGTKEPYRMFTSRAEYRLLLREDNADVRLSEEAYKLGFLPEHKFKAFENKLEAIEQEKQRLKSFWLQPKTLKSAKLEEFLQAELSHEFNALQLLGRPEITYDNLTDFLNLEKVDAEIAKQLEIEVKYEGYTKQVKQDITRIQNNEATIIPDDFAYDNISGLSNELVQKLCEIKPTNIGQASRIQGMTPAAISLLLVYLKRHKKNV